MLPRLIDLAPDHQFYFFVDQPFDALSERENLTVVHVESSRPTTEAAVADSNRSPFDMLRMRRAVARAPLDLMFFPAVYSWFPVPLRLPVLLTVYDAIAERYPKLIFPNWKSRLLWTLKMKAAVWSSTRILTISEAAKREIVEYIGVSPGMIDVTTAGPNPDFEYTDDQDRKDTARLRAGLPIDKPLIIFVGGLAPHKNLHGLLDGLEQALENPELRDLHLALVGDFKGAGFFSNYESLARRVSDNRRLKRRVHFTGYVSDEDLVALYSSSIAVAMPSFSEGFGLPAIEAMACAAPVLSSKLGSLPEVVGDAGLFFDPFDSNAIAAAIVKLATNDQLRSDLSQRALDRAGEFSWDRAAHLTLQYLEAMQVKR